MVESAVQLAVDVGNFSGGGLGPPNPSHTDTRYYLSDPTFMGYSLRVSDYGNEQEGFYTV